MEFDVKTALKAIANRHDIAEWDEFQEKERQKLQQALMGFQDVASNYRHGINAVQLGKSEIRSMSKKDPDYDTRVAHERNRIAEGLALQGQFEEAFEWASDADKRAEYQSVVAALTAKPCGHKEVFAKQRFYRDGVKTLMCCPKCNSLYVE